MIIMTIITMWDNDEGHLLEKPMSDKKRDKRRKMNTVKVDKENS
jgi:hypothetical protein